MIILNKHELLSHGHMKGREVALGMVEDAVKTVEPRRLRGKRFAKKKTNCLLEDKLREKQTELEKVQKARKILYCKGFSSNFLKSEAGCAAEHFYRS